MQEKLNQLKEDLSKVTAELDRLSQLRLNLLGAIEILESLEEESVEEAEIVKEEK